MIPLPRLTPHWHTGHSYTSGIGQNRRKNSSTHWNLTLVLPSLSTGTRTACSLWVEDLPINAHQGWYYLVVPPYDQAIEPLQKTIEMDSSFALAHWYLGLAYEQQGIFKDAIAEFEKAVSLTDGRPSLLALLAHAYAAANKRSEAESILEQLRALSKQKYVPSYPVAAIYVALGRKDDAFVRLDKPSDEYDGLLNWLNFDGSFDG